MTPLVDVSRLCDGVSAASLARATAGRGVGGYHRKTPNVAPTRLAPDHLALHVVSSPLGSLLVRVDL